MPARSLASLAVFLASVAVSAAAASSHPSVHRVDPAPVSADDLARLAPAADPKVIELALAAMRCAQSDGVGIDAERLGVIDYSRSSLQPRLWVFDLAARRLLYQEVVAHGQGSGGDKPTHFSNDDGSHASS